MQTVVRVAIGVLLVVAVGLVILLVLPLLGVPVGFGPFASIAPSPSASVSPSLAPSPSEAPSASASAGSSASNAPTATPTAPDQGFICGFEVTLAATGGTVAHTADVRVSTHSGYDRIVFEYLEDSTPAFEIDDARPPYTQDPSDQPMTVSGSPVLEIILNGATKLADDGTITYTGPTDFLPRFPQLTHLTERGDFEAVNTWYVGLNGGNCVRAAVLTDPSRIVVDVQH